MAKEGRVRCRNLVPDGGECEVAPWRGAWQGLQGRQRAGARGEELVHPVEGSDGAGTPAAGPGQRQSRRESAYGGAAAG